MHSVIRSVTQVTCANPYLLEGLWRGKCPGNVFAILKPEDAALVLRSRRGHASIRQDRKIRAVVARCANRRRCARHIQENVAVQRLPVGRRVRSSRPRRFGMEVQSKGDRECKQHGTHNGFAHFYHSFLGHDSVEFVLFVRLNYTPTRPPLKTPPTGGYMIWTVAQPSRATVQLVILAFRVLRVFRGCLTYPATP